MDKFMKNLKKWWGWITLGTAIFTTIIGLSLKIIYAIEKQDKLIIETQTLARKSLIWNSDYPLIERAEECDEYLAAGNNSVTKKLCDYIIEKEENIGNMREEGVNYEK